ncbi:glycerol dehydratase reactivase beta/small subunit family protein [Halegenticoccus tardaugens]|uniref:glycerol dehydratase reactivase beta/small subunit family protein n=1 Tax=Halegenticoccus tardaugens TaxID=2071624 RepID=UPI00100ACB30|nr:glycerol dehydratase reactivase beta/small subunit family protein [Halegenticoccus tardaugens]
MTGGQSGGRECGKPAVHVRYAGECSALVRHVEYGLEEESVPWALRESSADAVTAAYEAADASRLRVGVGVSSAGEVVLHHRRLPEREPLTRVADATPGDARAIGSNAARLVKRLPLRPLADGDA